MSFLNKFIYSVGAVILALALIALFLPSQTNVRRGITIDASRATVFALINDFHQVNKWSHWLEDDPNARTAYSGPRRGVGARFAWDGNIVGKGSQTISESVPFERVVMALEFDDRGNATTVFELSETDEGTLLESTFNMDIGFDLVARYVGLIVSGVIGENHEKGLENLKSLAEGLPRADFFIYYDDFEYTYSIRRAGFQLIVVPQSRVFHLDKGRSTLDIMRERSWG